MSAFLIVNYDIDNPELYGEYQAGAIPALKVGTDCEVVVFDTDSQHVEGDHTGRTTVVLKFESMEKAREIYDSGEYQAVVGKRLAASSNHFAVLVNTLG
jgi:uncharacterized protein (DUF1330 family)